MINQLMSLGYVLGGWNYTVGEHHIYGSSRIGVHQTAILLRTRYASGEITITLEDVEYTSLYRGKRHYELSNHLGNVQVVISDKRISVCDTELEVEYFKAEVLSAVDYYPFGAPLPDRQWYANNDSSGYSFGFNGMRKDDEISGVGNSLDFGARIYDSRLGRWLSVDPFSAKYPGESPFMAFGNNPVFYIDHQGLYRINPSQKGDYPVLENVLANIVNVVMQNSELRAHLMSYGSFETEEDLLNVLRAFSGPVMNVGNMQEDANTDVSNSNEITVNINSSIVRKLERTGKQLNQEGISQRKRERLQRKYNRRLTHLLETILHETVHVGDAQKGIKSGKTGFAAFSETDINGNKYEELGWAFEAAANLASWSMQERIVGDLSAEPADIYGRNAPQEPLSIESKKIQFKLELTTNEPQPISR